MLDQDVFVRKTGLIVKSLQGLLVVAVLASCGHKKANPPEPCSTGLNQTQCTVQIVEPSVWTQKLQSYESDPKTNQKIPASVRDISVVYEFFPRGAEQRLRRTMLIEGQGDNSGMFEEGHVTKIDGSSFEFVIDRTSCDDMIHIQDQGSTIYYIRSGGGLTIDNQPIQVVKGHGFFDVFGNMIGTIFTRTIRSLLESSFTFGSAKGYLTSGEGSLNASKLVLYQELQAKNIALGCFSTIGTGFSKSNLQPDWNLDPVAADNLSK